MVSRPSAPGSLELVEAFLRTRNEITDLAAMRTWSAAHGLPGEMTRDAYERALRLREALRSLMLANNGGPADPAAVDTVNAEITASGLRPQPLGPPVRRLRLRRQRPHARLPATPYHAHGMTTAPER